MQADAEGPIPSSLTKLRGTLPEFECSNKHFKSKDRQGSGLGESGARHWFSGRTKPCIFSCESKNSDDAGEYVVKLKAGMDNGVKNLSAELLGSLLADFFDIPSPKPAIINIDPALAEIFPDKRVIRC